MEADLDRLWAALRPDEHGLVTCVVQHAGDGQVLMVGHMNDEALARTLARGRVTFWSRSRRCLWEKGESSGHTLELAGLWVDCDADALLARAWPRGPTCHTLAPSCFFRQVAAEPPHHLTEEPGGQPPPLAPAAPAPPQTPSHGPAGDLPQTPASRAPLESALSPPHLPQAPASLAADLATADLAPLHAVEAVIRDRIAGRGATNREGKSYVRTLAERGPAAIDAKLREEAAELGEALAAGDRQHIAAEAADLLFHALVGLAAQDLGLADVARVLAARLGVSGIDEKAARPPKP